MTCSHMEERDAALASAKAANEALISARAQLADTEVELAQSNDRCDEWMLSNRRHRRAFYGTLAVCAFMTMAA